ncbi:MAG: enoyl-CoA hydratase/isomerase family protein [Chloroflexi bacterium]|nr:enoyl-CoA hydratase/isomerase family protein [Chloroflexota bacterium]
MSEVILTRQREAIFEIILNRPERRNAISFEMVAALGQAIAAAERAPGVRAVLLRGKGPVFSAGIDLTAFAGLPARYGENWPRQMQNITAELQGAFTRALDDLDRGLQLEAMAQQPLVQTRDFAAGVDAMLKKQPGAWRGE